MFDVISGPSSENRCGVQQGWVHTEGGIKCFSTKSTTLTAGHSGSSVLSPDGRSSTGNFGGEGHSSTSMHEPVTEFGLLLSWRKESLEEEWSRDLTWIGDDSGSWNDSGEFPWEGEDSGVVKEVKEDGEPLASDHWVLPSINSELTTAGGVGGGDGKCDR